MGAVMSGLQDILAVQGDDGSFPSQVHRPGDGGVTIPDANAFVTVHVVRCLARAGPAETISRSIDRALDYLQRCEQRRGAYGFWPAAAWPRWAPRFGPDADDTALLAGTLLAAGRLSGTDVEHAVGELSRARVPAGRPAPAWVRPAAFGIWLDQPRLVDCTVNANVVTFLAQAGWGDWRGCRAALAMIDDALGWASGSWPRLVSLSPFYAGPADLRAALAAAVTAGAAGARSVLTRCDDVLARTVPPRPAPGPTAVCCSAYGLMRWTSPVLQAARAWRTTTAPGLETPAA